MSETKANNPLTAGINISHAPQPCTLVIFGGGGDLSRRKLLPAVYNQALDGELPANFAVLGFAIEKMDDGGYREFARQGIEQFSRQPLDPAYWPDFERCLHYLGKETVQNILAMRFANAIFEPLWNAKPIDHVQITVAEEEGSVRDQVITTRRGHCAI